MSDLLFSNVDQSERIPPRHPLRKIRQVANEALSSLNAEFEERLTDFARPRSRRKADPRKPAADSVLVLIRVA
ncbi:hypothetical protein GGD87_003593 [Rhodobaca bogoriensis DSM 18756]|nr:hypothetical protein [Rhodobaca bogoriensis DSM 18756]